MASNQITDLLRREADIAVRMAKPAEDNLISRHIGNSPVGIYAHANYLRGRSIPRTMHELLQHDLVGFDHDDCVILGLRKLGFNVDRNSFRIRTDDHLALVHAIKAGMGIGFLETYVAREEPDLIRLQTDLPLPPLAIWLTVHRGIRSNQLIRTTYNFLANALRTQLDHSTGVNGPTLQGPSKVETAKTGRSRGRKDNGLCRSPAG